jgi:preprotein translocase subunit SecE
VSDVAAGANEDDRNEPDREERGEPKPAAYARPSGRQGGGLRFYKPGQGYYTRICTAVGGAVLVLWGALALYEQLSSLINPRASYALAVSYGVAAAFVVGLGAFMYWLVGMNRRANDFFIATEGEMKKVSWSSKKEVIRSTKVVIGSVLMLGAMLFVVDLTFMWFFHLLGVLKAFPGFASIFGLKS